ncbi:hypothetical protein TNCV_4341021 [Trichonephila clavipes]|nr:hypothetical protein TNCV_4341021 [Trichonephila clavipes]
MGVRFQLDVETLEKEIDHSREESDEIMEINHAIESEFEKKYEHETFESKGRFSNASLRTLSKKNINLQVNHKTHCALSKRHKKEKFNMLYVDHLRIIKLQ